MLGDLINLKTLEDFSFRLHYDSLLLDLCSFSAYVILEEHLICWFITVLLQDPVNQSVFWKIANNSCWAEKLNRYVRSTIFYKHKQEVFILFSLVHWFE